MAEDGNEGEGEGEFEEEGEGEGDMENEKDRSDFQIEMLDRVPDLKELKELKR